MSEIMTGSGSTAAGEFDGRDVLTAVDGAGVDDSPLGVQHRGRHGFGRFDAVPRLPAVGHLLRCRRPGAVVPGLIPVPGLMLVLVQCDDLVRLVRFRFSHVVLSKRSVGREFLMRCFPTT
ncbi:hypothetical protein ACFWPV_05505 [Streptomyces uncialis]|uniref:hypothetical protein n=1 Tax=Streptomyces uncialis TaxID=1048205 RepID=UPI00366583B9